MAARCPICLTTGSKKLRKVDCTVPNLPGPNSYDLMLCDGCLSVFIDPLPSQETLSALYEGSTHGGSAYTGEAVWGLRRFYLRRLIKLKEQLDIPSTQPIRILEVGAGKAWMCGSADLLNGQSLTVAQDLVNSPPSETYGVDQYICGGLYECFEEINALGPFDVISMSHVIEHLSDPVEMLGVLKKLMAPNSILFVTCPHRPKGFLPDYNFNGWEAWSLNHVPAHIVYVSDRAVNNMARDLGFELVYYDNTLNEGIGQEFWLSPKGCKAC